MPPRLTLPLALLLVGAGLVTGCTGDDAGPDQGPGSTSTAPVAVAARWREVELPVRAAGARAAARDATWCGDRWLVVGGVVGPGGRARPAAWSSRDGERWRPVVVRAATYWGRRAVVLGVACRGAVPVAVGAMSGGAHANPRVSTFRPLDDDTWVDVPAPAEQYGGPSAVNVGPVAAGDPGWLIAGNRRSGPAVWVAPDPKDFDLVEGAPGLSDGAGLTGLAQDAVWDGSAWLVVGGAHTDDALDRRPQAWSSRDGRRWTREPVPGTEGYDDLQRVIAVGGQVVAAGVADGRFATWVRNAGGWREGGSFGGFDPDGGSAPRVTGLAAGPTTLLATTSDGAELGLWGLDDAARWWRIEMPLAVTASAEHALLAAAHEEDVLLVADTGDGARAWLAPVPVR